MGGFSPNAFSIAAFSVAAFAFTGGTAPPVEVAAPEQPRYYSVNTDTAVQALRRQQLEEDEVILALIQQFVMET